MVKKIISIVILALLAVRLITFPWPTDIAGILSAVSLVVLSVAAGIAIVSLLPGGDEE